MHKSERGIHVQGGLLLMCTWWVFTLGAFYTVIRKNVPYLPTPKDDKEVTNFKIVVPNIVVGMLSIAAIIYGLSIDFTPFSIVMSGFALLNALIMFYTLVFAYQKMNPICFPSHENSIIYKKTTRNKVFKFFSSSALFLVVLTVIGSAGLQYYGDYVKWEGVTPAKIEQHTINYIGIFAPKEDNGLTNLVEAKRISNMVENEFNLISLYLAWNKDIANSFSSQLIDAMYKQNSIPIITWEPWINTFDENIQEQHVFDLISLGYFDDYLKQFAYKLKDLNRPVFLRFAHEFDNPFYPWYYEGNQAPAKFKMAWVHVYEIFKNEGAENVIWIWNPWKSEHIADYYPGKAYVDWMGVNALNYGNLNGDGQWHEFEELYEPYHDAFKKLPPTPVVISEFGSLKNNPQENSSDWINNAVTAIENNFKEIKSIIYFNSKVDNNWPSGERVDAYLDWSLPSSQTKIHIFANKVVPNYIPGPLPAISTEMIEVDESVHPLTHIKGINLKQGQSWENDYHVLNRKKLISNFKDLKTIGINTLKYQGNSIYDYNVLNISKKTGLNLAYTFWIPEHLDFMKDTMQLTELKAEILERVRHQKYTAHIVSWHIENDVQYRQNNFYHKPSLLYQNRAYVLWLKALAEEIKNIDATRPLIVDVEVNPLAIFHINRLLANSMDIDAIGLVVKETDYLNVVTAYLKDINKHYIISDIKTDDFAAHPIVATENTFFINSWQDKHESNALDFNGIVDRKGRYKPDYVTLASLLQEHQETVVLPKIKILRPARLIYDESSYTFHAMVYHPQDGWQVASKQKDLKIEWSLIKCDAYGNYLALKAVGTKAKLSLKIPKNYTYYKLHLSIVKGDYVTSTLTTLNTPLHVD